MKQRIGYITALNTDKCNVSITFGVFSIHADVSGAVYLNKAYKCYILLLAQKQFTYLAQKHKNTWKI